MTSVALDRAQFEQAWLSEAEEELDDASKEISWIVADISSLTSKRYDLVDFLSL